MSQPGRPLVIGIARRLLLVILLPVAAAAGELDPALTRARLTDVVVAVRPEATTITLRTSTVPKYHADFIDSPARLVLDMEETTLAWRGPLEPETSSVKRIRASQYRQGVTRVVVELDGRPPYAINADGDGLVIRIPTAARGAVRAPVATVAPVTASNIAPVVAPETVPVRIAQAAPPPARPAPPAPTGRLISLDFKDADVVNLLRILAAESGKNIVISDDVKGKMSITLRNVPWDQALDIVLEARGLSKIERGNVIRIVTQEQLAKEREAVARIEEARVKSEAAKANADAEIRAKGAEAALKEQEAQQRKLAAEAAAAEQQRRGPLREETIRLAYADPEDVAKTLQGLLGVPAEGMAAATAPVVPPAGPPFSALYGQAPGPAPGATPTAEVLSKGITIRAHKPTNSIFIRHYEKDLERIKKLVRETLDVQLPQVKIEARLNQLDRSDLFDIGIQWGGAGATRDGRNVIVSRGVESVQNGTVISPTPQSFASHVNPFAPLALAGALPTIFPALAAGSNPLPFSGNIVTLPPVGDAATRGLGIGFGIIGTKFSLNLALQALESQNKTRSLSRPEIVTIENVKASIALGSDVPYATVSSAGTQVQFKEAVLKLEVTPTVIREPEATKVKMKIIVENNQQSGQVPSGAAGGFLPLINKQKAETEVIVKEGETLVIGGINQRTETEIIQKVPFLGDIPILGWLFKNRQFSTNPNRELVLFVTPTVLRDAPTGTGPTAPPAR